MTRILNMILSILNIFPAPIKSLILLVIFIGALIMLLNLIKLILDAIPFI